MERAEPSIPCVDYWPPETLTSDKLYAYAQIIAEKQITRPRVLYCKSTRSTTVEYLAAVPHEWILEELSKRVTSAGAAE